MSEIASAFVSLLPSAKGFGSKMESQVSGEVSGAGKRLGSGFGKMFALAGGALAAAGIGSFLKDSIAEAREAQKVGALTTSVIKATGGAANVTAAQVGKLAGALSAKTGIDDEVIQSGQNMLLTFKNVRNEAGKGNDIFNQSTKTLVDLSAAMGTEPKQAAIQLGKALNDPVKGITALTRVGVTFTEGQKKLIGSMVEGGNVMGAQKIILKELNSEFGGAAAAQATAGEKAAVAFGNLKEQIGTALLPVVDKVANVLSGKVIPAISGFVAGISSGKGAGGVLASAMGIARTALANAATVVTGTLLPALTNLWHALSPTLSEAFNIVKAAAVAMVAGVKALGPTLLATTAFIAQHKTAITALVLTVGTAVLAWKLWQGAILAWAAITKAAAAVQAAFNVVMAANPIGLVIVALLALGVGLVYAYKHSETFRNGVNGAFNAIKSVVIPVVHAVKTAVVTTWNALRAATAAAWHAIAAVTGPAWNLIKNTILLPMRVVLATLRGDTASARSIMNGAWSAIKSLTTAAWNAIKSAVQSGVQAVLGYIKSLPGKIKAVFSGAASWLVSAGQDIIRGLINGIKSMAGAAADAAKNAVKGALDGAKSLLGIHSPSTKFAEVGKFSMLGLKKGIDDNADKARDAMIAALKKQLDVLTSHRDKIKSLVDQIRSDMGSMKDSISQAFTGDLFGVSAIAESLTETTFTAAQSVGQVFASTLADKRGQLKDLLAAFRQLKKWGLPSGFLSQLFASGNSALILEMAGGSRGVAQQDARLFGQVNSLSSQLGGSVAQNQYGAELRKQTDRMERVERAVKQVGADVAQALNNKAGDAHRKKRKK